MPDWASMQYPSDLQKIRFICSNHMMYHTPEKLESIMNGMEIEASKFDISKESWWESVGWWKNEAFLNALVRNNVELEKEIVIKVNRTDSQKYFVSSKK